MRKEVAPEDAAFGTEHEDRLFCPHAMTAPLFSASVWLAPAAIAETPDRATCGVSHWPASDPDCSLSISPGTPEWGSTQGVSHRFKSEQSRSADLASVQAHRYRFANCARLIIANAAMTSRIRLVRGVSDNPRQAACIRTTLRRPAIRWQPVHHFVEHRACQRDGLLGILARNRCGLARVAKAPRELGQQ